MGEKAEEFRAEAQRLEERAQTVADEKTRTSLLDVARRWRELAQDVARYETDSPSPPGRGRQNRKAAIAALSRAVLVYWDHEKARPMPEHLAKLAAMADEAPNTELVPAPNSPSLPEDPGDGADDLAQVKDGTGQVNSINFLIGGGAGTGAFGSCLSTAAEVGFRARRH